MLPSKSAACQLLLLLCLCVKLEPIRNSYCIDKGFPKGGAVPVIIFVILFRSGRYVVELKGPSLNRNSKMLNVLTASFSRSIMVSSSSKCLSLISSFFI